MSYFHPRCANLARPRCALLRSASAPNRLSRGPHNRRLASHHYNLTQTGSNVAILRIHSEGFENRRTVRASDGAKERGLREACANLGRVGTPARIRAHRPHSIGILSPQLARYRRARLACNVPVDLASFAEGWALMCDDFLGSRRQRRDGGNELKLKLEGEVFGLAG
jgi:hypothetical protein